MFSESLKIKIRLDFFVLLLNVDHLNAFLCLLIKQDTAFKRKDAISTIHVSPVENKSSFDSMLSQQQFYQN